VSTPEPPSDRSGVISRLQQQRKPAATIPDNATRQDSTYDRLLTTAAALFRKKGYSAATTRELASLIGIQKASLYHHMAGKEDLLYSICVESLTHMYSEVARSMAQERTPVDRLRSAIRAHMAAILADQDKHTTMLLELRSLQGVRRDHVVELRDQYEGMLQSAIEECQGSGAIRVDISSRYLCLALLNILNWTIIWFRPDGGMEAKDVSRLVEVVYLEGTALLGARD